MESDDFAGDVTTTGVLPAEGSVSGVIEDFADVDFFAIELEAGDMTTIEVSGGFELSLFDANGDFVVGGSFNDDTAQLLASVNRSGTFFVAVSSFTGLGGYTLVSETVEGEAADITGRDALTINGFGRDAVLHEQSGILFIATGQGVLQRYDTATDSFLTPLTIVSNPESDLIETQLVALALSADGETLLIGQGPTAGGGRADGITIHRLDLNTMALDSFTSMPEDFPNISGVTDLSFDADGRVIVSVSLRIDGSLPQFVFPDIDSLAQPAPIETLPTLDEGVDIVSSFSGEYLLFTEGPSTSGAPGFAIYSSATGDVVVSGQASDFIPFNDTGFARNAISGEAELIAIVTTDNAIVVDFDLNLVANLSEALSTLSPRGSVSEAPAFTASGDHLIVYDALNGESNSEYVVFDTLTWEVVGRFDSGLANVSQFDLTLAPDGATLIFRAPRDIELIDLSQVLQLNLNGDGGDNILNGDVGADTIFGGAGNDILKGGGNADVLDGGAGLDAVSYEGSDAAVIVDLGAGTVSGGHADGDQIISIEGAIGSSLDDTLLGSSVDNVLSGSDGADVLAGRNGNDVLNGGAGDDVLFGETDNDTLNGDEGNDLLLGGFGNDTLSGGTGFDFLIGDDGDDVINGDGGIDRIEAGTGDDTVDGGDQDDVIFGQLGVDLLRGGFGADFIDGGTEDDRIEGGGQNDVALGGFGNDTLLGEEGDDTLFGEAGLDTLDGGIGNDTLLGGAGDDALSGGDGDDVIFGETDNDTLSGGAGNDLLLGGQGNDTVTGGDGFDFLIGDDGDDMLNGEGGIDRVEAGTGADIVDGGDGDDVIFGQLGVDTIFGGAGADFIDGGTEDDRIEGGDQNDVALGGFGDDTLLGDAGDDTLFGEAGTDTLDGGAGNDVLVGGAGNDTINGGIGNDTAFGETGDDTINGGAGDDGLNGQAGDDVLSGGEGNDVLAGELGADRLDGGAGNDTLFGGADLDTFVFSTGFGSDTIADFTEGETIDLSALGLSGFADLTVVADGADTLVSVTGQTDTIRLTGIDANTIDADDFMI